MEDIKYWIWLSFFKLNPIEKIRLLKSFNNKPKDIFNIDMKKISSIINTKEEFKDITKRRREKIILEILQNRKKYIEENLDEYIKNIKENNIFVITCIDERYPKRLLHIYDYPILLYVKGNVNILNNKGFAIVGCRQCTEYGAKVSRRISNILSENSLIVISGLARGIDSYAHLGCIDNGKETIAVLGSGINVIYPKENKHIYEKIIESNGAIISEYYLDMEPRKENFPMRNRIVSGMSEGVIVIEAKKKSGSLITANLALEQGKEVYSVPRKYYK